MQRLLSPKNYTHNNFKKIALLALGVFIHNYVAYAQLQKVKIGIQSTGSSEISLKLAARIQSYNRNTEDKFDFFDEAINSPKSALILEKNINGRAIKKLYINNLEGDVTSIYDMNQSYKKIGEIRHKFTSTDSNLFQETNFPSYSFKIKKKHPNIFNGKPVEMCVSNNGKYLWVTYYRRDYDKLSTEPSAVALIDTYSDKIIRVFPAAPLPKMIACSEDEKYIAITNWGDNTVHLIDISSNDPKKFQYVAHFVVEHKLELKFNKAINRDNVCGFCLRGTVFTPDKKYLFVGRMGGGGIAVFDVKDKKYIGTLFGTKTNVRHLVINGDYLYLSSNSDGIVEKTKWKDLLSFMRQNAGQKDIQYKEWQMAYTGKGARTITVTEDGKYLFANANKESKISIVRTADMTTIGSINADPFPVGMALDKSNQHLIVTAQGRDNIGGNSVMIYEISRLK